NRIARPAASNSTTPKARTSRKKRTWPDAEPTPAGVERICLGLGETIAACKDWLAHGHRRGCPCSWCEDTRALVYFLPIIHSGLEGELITTRAMAQQAGEADAKDRMTPAE